MKKTLGIILMFTLFQIHSFAQNSVSGIILDGDTEEPLFEVVVAIKDANISVTTDKLGAFKIDGLADGVYLVKISKKRYEVQNYPIEITGSSINLGKIYLYKDASTEQDLSVITIADDELNADDGFTDNIAGLLQSSRDVFNSAAAFDFSATFFRPRGLDNANGKVLINGIEMNKTFNGRPQWANWGGLNDLQRNQVFSPGISANDYTFGDIAGTNNIIMRASQYGKGTRISFASANRSYNGRVMASHSSGIGKNGWSYAFLASRRFGNEGYVDGTFYDANSFFASIEKKINEKHSINANLIYAQNKRGRSAPITEEIFRLKGRQYNPNWGYQAGKMRNSRTRDIEEPIVMLNHYWNISEKTTLNTNVSYQFGSIGNSRIDNGGTRLVTNPNGQQSYIGGARNPTPEYYQNLPSYFLSFYNLNAFNFQNAFLAEQEFINNGQFDWDAIYLANSISTSQGHNAIYAMQEDRIDDNQLSVNTIFASDITQNIRLNASLNYRGLRNQSYAELTDLFGATGFLDVDFFAEENSNTVGSQLLNTIAQSDVRNPNRIVTEGDRYKYNYKMNADVASAFAQAQFSYTKVDFYVAGNYGITTYQRDGLFENGNYQGNLSYGKSEKLEFDNFGLKAGLTYKISGQHLINFNSAYFTKAPTLANSFENARQNNRTVRNLQSETVRSLDASYILRTPMVKARLTGYYSDFSDGTDINFFFTEVGGAFVQEIITGIDRRNFGGELGIEAQVTPTIKLKGVAAVGQNTFTNNPDVYYTSDDFGTARLTYGSGKTNLKNYHVSSGPERAFQLGFEYRDPDFWWIGATANHFSRAFVDVSALKRSDAFAIDLDLIDTQNILQPSYGENDEINISGNTFNDYDENVARGLLRQEQLNSSFIVNVIGGKSWKLGDYYLGFFATINNIFNVTYKTGGFEQSRRVGYRDQVDEQSQQYGPVFGNRYFFGNGTTYFLNLYLRF